MVKYFPKERLAINRGLMKSLDILLNKYPLKSPNRYSPFFIIGAGRSGTTLLRTILNNHPEIIIPPETFGFRNAFFRFKCFQFLSWDVLSNSVLKCYESGHEFFLWELDLAPAYEQSNTLPETNKTFADLIHLVFQSYLNKKAPGARIWGDKTPLNTYYLDWVFKTFPQAKFINMIRDGRDVVSSLMKANLTNVNNGCLRWNQAIENAKNFESIIGPQQFLTIYYENLVSSPQESVKRICHFLDVSFDDSLLANEEKTANMKDVNFYKHFNNLLNPINKNSIGKWKKNLATNHQLFIQDRLAKNLESHGYR
jgi:hypothetical protein